MTVFGALARAMSDDAIARRDEDAVQEEELDAIRAKFRGEDARRFDRPHAEIAAVKVGIDEFDRGETSTLENVLEKPRS